MECEVDQCGVVPSAGTLVDPVVAWRHPASLKLFRVPMRGTIKNYRNGDWSEWRETNGKRGRGLAGALMTPPTTTGIAALGTRAGTMDVHNGRGGRNEENLKTTNTFKINCNARATSQSLCRPGDSQGCVKQV